jgi:hypothetical protein
MTRQTNNFLYGNTLNNWSDEEDHRFDPLSAESVTDWFELDCNHHRAGLYYQANQFKDHQGFFLGRFMVFLGDSWKKDYSWKDRFSRDDLFRKPIMPAFYINPDLQTDQALSHLLNLQQLAFHQPLDKAQETIKQSALSELVKQSVSSRFEQKNIGNFKDYSTASFLTFNYQGSDYLIHSEAIWMLQDIYPQQKFHYRVKANTDLVYIFFNNQLLAIIKSFSNRVNYDLFKNNIDHLYKKMATKSWPSEFVGCP